ncbi:hypothetical protein QMN07_18330 [Leptospira santarosai]|uniref:hypothetical protein n=1 Tax=Leptospira santarosai TaxID=28183 RepID=UPI0024AF9B49|nr:hypothetical protein [Leptospira santarosai]MDI7219447.1 hypothetical protein [Leptospira santarosai]
MANKTFEYCGSIIEYSVIEEDGKQFLTVNSYLHGEKIDNKSFEKVPLGEELPNDPEIIVRHLKAEWKTKILTGRFDNCDFSIYNSLLGGAMPPENDERYTKVHSGKLKANEFDFSSTGKFSCEKQLHFVIQIEDVQTLTLALYPTNDSNLYMGTCYIGDIAYAARIDRLKSVENNIEEYEYEIIVS